MDDRNFVLAGDICYSANIGTLRTLERGFAVCLDGKCAGAFPRLPEVYAGLPLADRPGRLIVPGLADLHIHAPQFGFRALGMDLELLEWLQTRTFPEEARYAELDYARRAYTLLADDLRNGPNTRFCFFATIHADAALLLADIIAEAGLAAFVGKVSMDRNCPDNLREQAAGRTDAEAALGAVRGWLDRCGGHANIRPILTPRFIPSCSDTLMRGLAEIARSASLPVQSHLSENRREVEWVRELCQESGYGEAYAKAGLFGDGVPTVMAHCVRSDAAEIRLLAERGVFVAHCPQSNANLASGIAPVRKLLDAGVAVGLGSDVAGGAHTSIFRAMADAIQASKLRKAMVDETERPLTLEEAFFMGTAGGGAFFGGAGGGGGAGGESFGAGGSFDSGYDFDAVVIDDRAFADGLSIRERLERVVYLSDDRNIEAKYVIGKRVR